MRKKGNISLVEPFVFADNATAFEHVARYRSGGLLVRPLQ